MTCESKKESSVSSLEQLLDEMSQCRRCAELFGFEPRPIHWGNPNAKIMHISQAPGIRVHQCGRPFSDPSGNRLRQSWYLIDEETFYNPDNFYFTTMGHCYPGKGKNSDRKPPKCCYDLWTSKEIELMKDCRLYLVVGQEAASRLFPGRRLTELVFEDHTLNGKPCYILPHPSGRNGAWFKQHPEFEQKRIPLIRQAIHEALGLEQTEETENAVKSVEI